MSVPLDQITGCIQDITKKLSARLQSATLVSALLWPWKIFDSLPGVMLEL